MPRPSLSTIVTWIALGVSLSALGTAVYDRTTVVRRARMDTVVHQIVQEIRTNAEKADAREQSAAEARERLEAQQITLQRGQANLEARVRDLAISHQRVNRDILRAELGLIQGELTRESSKAFPSKPYIDFLNLRQQMLQSYLRSLK